MANSSLVLSSLDFDTLKQNFKNYLTSQSVFKDYDFNGSNINVLLDVMSYNSYLNAFYLNMIASEMFLDSAQKYDSVVSHAKELNYNPQSYKSSIATISFSVDTSGISSPFTVPKGTKFSGTNSNGSYTFTTSETYYYNSPNSTFNVSSLNVYEGVYFTDAYVMNYDLAETQRFLITNDNVDDRSIKVTVTENGTNTTFSKAETLFGLNSSSEVYFLQASQNNQYEIIFGDDLFGRKPLNLSTITIEYRVAAGPNADGVSSFVCSDDLGLPNGGTATIGIITVSSNSSGGAIKESIESIRTRAPRYFATQQRAVSSDDYSSLILSQFGGEIDDVIIYGGEQLPEKLYGRVVVCIKPAGSTVASDNLKNDIVNYLQNYIVLPNRVITSDPDYFYCKINTIVQYDATLTTKSKSELENLLSEQILQFGDDHLGMFGSDFRYSKFVSHIDNTEASITSNDTEVYMIKRITPELYYPTSYEINYGNESGAHRHKVAGQTSDTTSIISSSSFTYVDSSSTEYPLSYIRDNDDGVLEVYTTINDIDTVINSNIGSIDYVTGQVIINSLKVSEYSSYISLYMVPKNKDIIASQNKILLFDSNDISISLIETVN
jgi:hypothetical protein